MRITRKDHIADLIEKDSSIRLGNVKRNLDAIHNDLAFLPEILESWQNIVKQVQDLIPKISSESLQDPNLDTDHKTLANYYDELLDLLARIKEIIVIPNNESFVLEVQSAMEDTLRSLFPIIQAMSSKPALPPHVNIVASGIQSLPKHLQRVSSLARRIQSINARRYTFDNPSLIEALKKAAANTRLQIFLWGIALVILIIFGLTESELELKLREYYNLGKLVILFTVLWFPLLFIIPGKRYATEFAVYSLVWSLIISIWCYGFVQGLVISLVLMVIPVSRLLSIKNTDTHKEFQGKFNLTTAISLLIVSFIIAREFIWVIGLTLWLTYWVFLRSTSYRFFRQNYDLIEELYPGPKSRDQRAAFFSGSLVFSTVILTTGMIGRIDAEFVSQIYTTITTFALALVTILLAVQAIIPGMNVWSKDTSVDMRIREMRFVIRANKGLGGFMSSFFYLLVLSLVGWLIAQRLSQEFSVIIDLSSEHNFTKIDLLNPFIPQMLFSEQATLLSLNSLLFAVCLSFTVYSIFQLYYLFSTASIFLLPIHDALFSNIVQINNVSVNLTKHVSEKVKIEQTIKEIFLSNRAFNGYVINDINIINDPADDDKLRVSILVNMDFVELDEMLRLAKDAYKAIFEARSNLKLPLSVQKTLFAVYRDTYARGKHNVFSLQIDRSEWEFMKREIPGFTLKYKVKNVLKAKIVDYVLPESQIF